MFILFPLLLWGQNDAVNPVLVNQEFLILINKHRELHGAGPLVLDQTMESFVYDHSVYQSKKRNLSHDNFLKRAKQYGDKYDPDCRIGENCADSYIPVSMGYWTLSVPHDGKGDVFEGYEELVDLINKDQCKEQCFANHVFLSWMYSPAHNENMLYLRHKSMYLGYVREGSYIYWTLWLKD